MRRLAGPAGRAYVKAVMDRIRANWMYPKSAGEQNIEGETRPKILDDAALVAVNLAQPFPPVPDSLCKNTLGLTGTFRYQIKRK